MIISSCNLFLGLWKPVETKSHLRILPYPPITGKRKQCYLFSLSVVALLCKSINDKRKLRENEITMKLLHSFAVFISWV